MSALVWIVRAALAALFVVAGFLKLRDPTGFATEIANYHLLPSLAPHLAIVLPPIEIATGLALVAPSDPWRRAGALAAAGLSLVFTVAVASAVARGMDVSCGCFGTSSERVSWLTIARDLGLVAAAAALVVFPREATPARAEPVS